jgi:hypothetical protein
VRINKFVAAGGLIVLLTVAMVGYFSFIRKAYPAGSLVCGPGVCTVHVSVADGCVPKPDFDPIIVLKENGATNIFWEAPTAYTFTDPDGILFKDNNGDVDPRPGRVNGGARWHVVDNPAHPVQIHYRIQVQSNTGTRCTGPDPVMWNQ